MQTHIDPDIVVLVLDGSFNQWVTRNFSRF